MKEKLEKALDMAWSDYSDLGYWIDAMSKGEQNIPKHVLKMAMKHLRYDFYTLHGLLCELKKEYEEGESENL